LPLALLTYADSYNSAAESCPMLTKTFPLPCFVVVSSFILPRKTAARSCKSRWSMLPSATLGPLLIETAVKHLESAMKHLSVRSGRRHRPSSHLVFQVHKRMEAAMSLHCTHSAPLDSYSIFPEKNFPLLATELVCQLFAVGYKGNMQGAIAKERNENPGKFCFSVRDASGKFPMDRTDRTALGWEIEMRQSFRFPTRQPQMKQCMPWRGLHCGLTGGEASDGSVGGERRRWPQLIQTWCWWLSVRHRRSEMG
jgi:hypothetical protein